MTTPTLEDLAEKHCAESFDGDAHMTTEYLFTLDRLRAFSLELIKQVAGEVVAIKSPGKKIELMTPSLKALVGLNGLKEDTPLHALNMEILK